MDDTFFQSLADTAKSSSTDWNGSCQSADQKKGVGSKQLFPAHLSWEINHWASMISFILCVKKPTLIALK